MTPAGTPARIGPCDVVREIGRGGMGVVYLGHDTRLGRDVAIKTLPPELADHPERLDRFEREARALASFNHANIGAIYGIEEVDGHRYLILEYVPGETLAEMLDRGPMPVGEALPVALQIAEAIECAHGCGLIHRDLKPDNVKITPEGKVKVLDFGIAKAGESRESGTAIAEAVTTPRSPTEPGAVVGTAPYMSPEQARGRSVDKRTDIWSFGVMVYEMLTGVGPFVGETSIDSIGAILHKDVDFDRLPPETPPVVRHLLALCLQRKRDDRLHDIADARIELQQAIAHPGAFAVSAATGSTRPAGLVASAAAGLVAGLVAAAAIAFAFWPDPPVSSPTRRFELPPIEGLTSAVIAPDGRKIALIVDETLSVHDLGTGELREIHRAEENLHLVTWSPDSAWIGFGRVGELSRVRASGGPALPITEDVHALMGSAAWTDDGELVVCNVDGGLQRVSVESGRAVTWLPPDAREIHLHPGGVLPGGGGALFVPHPKRGEASALCLATPDGERRVLYESEHEPLNPVYSPTGHIMFGRLATPKGIWALPFSLEDLAVTGEPFFVAPGGTTPSVSTRGDLVILSRPAGDDRPAQLTWLDRTGNPVEVVGPEMFGTGGELSLSPDGTKAALVARGRDAGSAENDARLWIIDLIRETASALPDDDTAAFGGVHWSPDGRRVAYTVMQGLTPEGVYVRNANGTGERELLFEAAGFPSFADDWSIAVMNAGTSVFDMHIVTERVGDPATRAVFEDGPRSDLMPVLRPGGGLVAYTSGDIPRQDVEVFLRPFPSGPGRWQVSTAGGFGAAWSPEGDRLFYGVLGDPDGGVLYEVPVTLTGEGDVQLGQATPLFEFDGFVAGLVVASGSERFLVIRKESTDETESQEPPAAVLIENWASSFRKGRR
ncbi:MAG: protein kinase [Phycisphaerales bacterium]|nr:protein kinase [Phycisphaerales bacterium]